MLRDPPVCLPCLALPCLPCASARPRPDALREGYRRSNGSPGAARPGGLFMIAHSCRCKHAKTTFCPRNVQALPCRSALPVLCVLGCAPSPPPPPPGRPQHKAKVKQRQSNATQRNATQTTQRIGRLSCLLSPAARPYRLGAVRSCLFGVVACF